MPYVRYLASATSSAYTVDTAVEIAFTSFALTRPYGDPSSTETTSLIDSATTFRGGIYGYSSSIEWHTTRVDVEVTGGVTFSTFRSKSYGATMASAQGTNVTSASASDSDGGFFEFSIVSFTGSASWNDTLYSFSTEGGRTTTYSFQNNYTSASFSSSLTFNAFQTDQLPYELMYQTTETTIEATLRKTTFDTGTFYGPLEESSTTYTFNDGTLTEYTLSEIKTTIPNLPFFNPSENKGSTFNIEWIGYEGSGDQKLALIYTTETQNADISEYGAVLMETDSYSSTNEDNIIYPQSGSFSSEEAVSYTLTYDYTVTNTESSTITTLNRYFITDINFFSYGFIETFTEEIEITTYTTSETTESYISASKGAPFIPEDTGLYEISRYSFSYVQHITTTSYYTQYFQITGLPIPKIQSFLVRSRLATTANYTYQNNIYFLTTLEYKTGSYSPPPSFLDFALRSSGEPTTNPDTFYTEVATFASFAEPAFLSGQPTPYGTAYKMYSPPDCSLVFLNLVALNDTHEEGLYASWISVYDGTFSAEGGGVDRAVTSYQSVTLNQSSSYLGSGSTNVYQTISYFIGNDTDSRTTKTTSIAMGLINEASSTSRLIRVAVENLTSAYMGSFLPVIPIVGSDIIYTQGLQTTHEYNIEGRLINIYTTAKSTFADSLTSSFPVSSSAMPYPISMKNKIRIDSVYAGDDGAGNRFGVDLLRFTFFYE